MFSKDKKISAVINEKERLFLQTYLSHMVKSNTSTQMQADT